MLTQMAVYETVKDGFLTRHLPSIRDLYKNQCGYMLDAMARHFPATCSWTRPEGGMFIWVRSEEHTSELQSLMRISYAVFCLKKKNKQYNYQEHKHIS